MGIIDKINENILLFHKNCLEYREGERVDLVLSDPPYGTTRCKWDSIIQIDDMWDLIHRTIKEDGAIVLFGGEPFSSLVRVNNIAQYKYDWVWEKPHTGQLNAKRMPLKNIENIMVFYEFQPTYNPQFEHGEPYAIERKGYRGSECYGKQRDHSTISDGRRYPRQVLKYKHDKNRIHPTQKPVELLEYLIKTYTNPGDTVFDFAMGSGSTGVACINTGRKFIGIEKNDEYYEVAKNRIQHAQSNKQLNMLDAI